MTGIRLQNKFLNNKNDTNRTNLKKQRNYSACIFRETKRGCYRELDTKKVLNDDKFKKAVTSLLIDIVLTFL